ncbi:MAG TPA: molybdopterin-binding protein [Candidatus Limnocylindrales bacterium]|nr:molybdopterin-binding protein [Candidatus Limnocylindrales bacterium]
MSLRDRAASSRPPARVLLLSIGSELLAGETVDTNAAFLGRELARLGLDLTGVRQLPDNRSVIAAAFTEARAIADVVLATGGLGPTHDDLTREGLAKALGEPLDADPLLEAQLRDRFGSIGRMPVSNLRQALRVPSADVLPNPIGSAPGWWVDRDEHVTVLMPGVPSEMRRMFAHEVAPRLSARFRMSPLHVRTVKTFGVGESAVAELLGELLERPGAGMSAGIYARDDGVHLRFSTRGEEALLAALADGANRLLGDAVWGAEGDDLATVALAALGRAGASTLASWEADTHGALLSLLAAAVPADGAARYLGGVLDAGGAPPPPMANAVLQLSLLPQDAHGRSRVRVALSGTPSLEMSELRIHGSGDQRLRRAAFAALDMVRRRL